MHSNKCVAYLRYSTKNQRGSSIEIQRKAIEEYCKINDLAVMAMFADCAVSGTTDKRPGFRAMIEEAKKVPGWSTVLVYDYSRFSRDYHDGVTFIELLRTYGVEVISVTEPYTKASDATFAENETYVRKISSATREGLAMRAREAKHCGGKPPYGYGVDDQGELIIEESEAEIVKRIFELFTDGYSYKYIEDTLRREGITDRSGGYFKKRSFGRMLKQKKYAGVYSWSAKGSERNTMNAYDIVIEDGCPAIVDRSTFEEAQRLLRLRSGGKAMTSTAHRTMLAGTGCIVCAECGEVMTVRQRRDKGKTYCIYVCPNHLKKSCSTKEIRSADVDTFVALTIVNLINKRIKNYLHIKGTGLTEIRAYRRAMVRHLATPGSAQVRALLRELNLKVIIDGREVNIYYD